MRVLLVDHDSEGLEAVARAIRGVLELDCVTSKGDALLLLRQNTYDVLIACERCVDGSGLDLLARTARTTAPLKRIFAAPNERVQLLGPRLAPFKVQRTINYPIDLEELWLAIAQVTGSNDDTDGTIERVVLDERGIPSSGTVPRGPIPPRPPAPLREARSAPAQSTMQSPAIAAAAGGRATAARLAQPAPEPALRPPPPPRAPPPPRTTSDTGRMRAPPPPNTTSDTGRMRAPPPPNTTSDTGRMRAPPPPNTTSDTGRMRAPPPPNTTSDTGRMRAPLRPNTTSDTGRMRAPLSPRTSSDTGRMRSLAPPMQPIPPMPLTPQSAPPLRDLGWAPESAPTETDFAEIAAQARLGVRQKVVDEAVRRKRKRLLTAGVIAVAVAAGIVFLIETFYDPEARARDRAIAAEVERMSEQQKVTDNLTRIEIDIENAIMKNDFDAARSSLAQLIEKSPEHPRREFLQASIGRAAELAKLESRNAAVPAVVVAQTELPVKKREERAPEPASPRTRDNERAAPRKRTASTTPASRSYGAPIGEEVPRASLPLDAPINSSPTTVMQRSDNSFTGRTLEASGAAVARPPANTPSSTQVIAPAQGAPSAGSAAIAPLPAAPAVPAAVDVVPAKLVKRVTPVAPASIAAKTRGEVVLRFEIGENGKVSQIEVVESAPQGVFDDAARDAVRKWVYEPRKENGVAVASRAQARLVFDIGK